MHQLTPVNIGWRRWQCQACNESFTHWNRGVQTLCSASNAAGSSKLPSLDKRLQLANQWWAKAVDQIAKDRAGDQDMLNRFSFLNNQKRLSLAKSLPSHLSLGEFHWCQVQKMADRPKYGGRAPCAISTFHNQCHLLAARTNEKSICKRFMDILKFPQSLDRVSQFRQFKLLSLWSNGVGSTGLLSSRKELGPARTI